MNNKEFNGTKEKTIFSFQSYELTPTPLCFAKRGYNALLPLLLLATEGGWGLSSYIFKIF